MLEAPLEELI